MKRLWKFIKWVGEWLPVFLAFGAAFYAGYILDDKASMHFFITMAAFFFVLRELVEIRNYFKQLFTDAEEEVEQERLDTDELPLQGSELRQIRYILQRLLEDEDEDNGGGRHSGAH